MYSLTTLHEMTQHVVLGLSSWVKKPTVFLQINKWEVPRAPQYYWLHLDPVAEHHSMCQHQCNQTNWHDFWEF